MARARHRPSVRQPELEPLLLVLEATEVQAVLEEQRMDKLFPKIQRKPQQTCPNKVSQNDPCQWTYKTVINRIFGSNPNTDYRDNDTDLINEILTDKFLQVSVLNRYLFPFSRPELLLISEIRRHLDPQPGILQYGLCLSFSRRYYLHRGRRKIRDRWILFPGP